MVLNRRTRRPVRRRLGRWPTVAVALTVTVGMVTVTSASAAPAGGPTQPAAPTPAGQAVAHHACDLPLARHVACLAIVDNLPVPTPHTRPKAAPSAGEAQLHPYLAADLQAAYNLPSALLGARQTIAIVDAYDDPNAEQDLAVYRKANGLPACDADFPCFRKVDQRGGTDYPPPDAGWAVEESLDLDMASAACPNCDLLLVEADDNTDTNIALAVDAAARLGANVVSNSYGEPEYTATPGLGSHYDHPGVVMTASSGDAGFGVNVPAALSAVVAVGGTALYQDSGPRGWAETAWPGAGSGCSGSVAKPRWQKDGLCDKRTVADVAGVADPATPVAVYDSYGLPGWVAVGGTSVAAPLVAGVYALAGNTATINPGAYLYAHTRELFDVTSGTNGLCGDGYLCTAATGYDGPTGWGTPNGIGAF